MPKATTIGLHGRAFLGLLYRYGALTRSQLTRLTGLSHWAVDRQLRHLERAGYVAQARDVAGWQRASTGRPKSAYHLTVPSGAKAGARETGIENDYLALRHYRRVGLPATVAHRLLANEYLLAVREAAGVEPGGVHSETYPGFPVFGAGAPKSDRADARYRFARIVPDGTFSLGSLGYYLEVETGSHDRKELVSKLADYGGRWRRMLRPNAGEKRYHDRDARLEPIVVLTPTAGHKRMRDYLRAHLPNAPDWAEAVEAISEVSGGRAEPGQLVIVAGMDEVRGDPLERAYRPLFRYPPQCSGPSPSGVPGWRVSLRDAATISERIPVPVKPPGPEEGPLAEEVA